MIEAQPPPTWMVIVWIIGILFILLGLYTKWTAKSKKNRLKFMIWWNYVLDKMGLE